jgi:hypothetical protein
MSERAPSPELGWNPRLNLPMAVDAMVDYRLPPFALSTIVDSTPVAQVSDLLPLLDGIGASHWQSGAAVAFEAATLRYLIDDDFFNGFDEIWFFDELPRLSRMPPRFTSEGEGDFSAVQTELIGWMRETGCDAALGDGVGLRFATSDPELASRWRA